MIQKELTYSFGKGAARGNVQKERKKWHKKKKQAGDDSGIGRNEFEKKACLDLHLDFEFT
ncbi:MAG: hypothetical protein SOU94_07770 [Acidaminococcus sp.]|uniref:hypothetical protein n=1 Tax=Acidaminococcus sp. TaxID=1872103 RepID=UPI002A75D7AB|nr:hypothetical protein [Acidaminococcus sp.]MDY2739709.1 hypothetical protein [Acidaminococcus sp.]